MARLRRPEGLQRGSNELPSELAMGPQIEYWTAGEVATEYDIETWRPYRARRRWAEAVDRWVVAVHWTATGEPALNARNLARTRYPWSREFLIRCGEQAYVDYLEGRTDVHPGRRRPDQWNPHF